MPSSARRDAPRRPSAATRISLVELSTRGQTQTQELVVRGDPTSPEAVLWGEEYDRQLELEEVLMHPTAHEAAPQGSDRDL